jgi:glycosyltransferase involved in cell wall biosynthesis
MTSVQAELRPVEDSSVELSVVLPCLNEAETLEVCITKAMAEIRRMGILGEVVIADNGSTDESQAIASRLGARVVEVPQKGYGAALLGGIRAARGTFVIMADADDSYALDDLQPFVDSLRAGSDLVMGNRFQGGIEPGAMPALHRYLGNPVLSWMGRTFFRTPIGDFHCGMRGFNRAAILGLDLQTPGMEFASEMVVRASLAQLRISEVPTTLRKDGRTRPPHLRTWRDGWRHLRFLLAYSPRWLFLYPGLLIAGVSMVGLLWLAGGQRVVAGLRFDVLTMLFLFAGLVVGLQAVWFSVIAKVFVINAGLHPPDARTARWLARFTLERMLVIGGLLALLGLGIMVWQIVGWARVDFGDLDVFTSVRVGILGVTMLVVGFQTIFSSFLLSLVSIERRSMP